MGDLEEEIVGSDKSIEEISVDELAVKTAKASKKGKKSGKTGFFSSLKSEFKKIIWPNRQSLGRQTVAVTFCSMVIALLIYGLDLLISMGLDKIIVK